MSEVGINELSISDGGIDMPLSYSNRVLSQFSGAGTDAYTINFTRLVCAPYKVAATGERVFNAALTNLPVFKAHATEPRLEFGWAEEFLLRNRGVHRFGYEHLILSSALVEGGLSEAYAAAVLSVLGERVEDTQGEGNESGMRVKPHIHCFEGLIRAANGILASTELAQIVDDRARLNPYGDASGHGSEGDASRIIPPREFAEAVNTVGNMAGGIGGKKEVIIVGGDTLAWFAATGEWLLGLNVKLEDDTGKVLHESHSGHEGLLRLVYVPSVGSEANSLPKTYGECLRLIGTTKQPTPSSRALIPFSGKVVWSAMLPKVFGKYFTLLTHQESRALANGLGGTARLFELFSNKDDVSEQIMSAENKANPAAHGLGLISTVTNWFPELRHLQGRMERVQKQDFDEVRNTCNGAATQLESVCGCDICTRDSTRKLGKNEFCPVTIMETIITLSLAMSRITVASKIYPSRAGILCIYHSQVAKRRKIQTLADVDGERFKILFGYEWNSTYSRRLRNVAAIFTGSWPRKDLPDNLIALTHEGICAYMLRLHQSDNGGRKKSVVDMDTIRVTSGSIAWKQKTFSRACMGPVSPAGSVEDGWEEIKCAHLDESLFFK